MTERKSLDDMTSNDLDQLYDQLAAAQDEARRWLAFIERGHLQHMSFGLIQPDGSTEQLACADWCHVCRTERAEATLARVRALAERWPYTSDCKGGPAQELRAALDEPAPAAGQVADSKEQP